jgi:hypothetical protein
MFFGEICWRTLLATRPPARFFKIKYTAGRDSVGEEVVWGRLRRVDLKNKLVNFQIPNPSLGDLFANAVSPNSVYKHEEIYRADASRSGVSPFSFR